MRPSNFLPALALASCVHQTELQSPVERPVGPQTLVAELLRTAADIQSSNVLDNPNTAAKNDRVVIIDNPHQAVSVSGYHRLDESAGCIATVGRSNFVGDAVNVAQKDSTFSLVFYPGNTIQTVGMQGTTGDRIECNESSGSPACWYSNPTGEAQEVVPQEQVPGIYSAATVLCDRFRAIQ